MLSLLRSPVLWHHALHSSPHSISDACSGFGGDHVQVGALVEVLHAGEHPDRAFPYSSSQSRASKDKTPICMTWEGDGGQNCHDSLNHQISTELWTSYHNCSSALCSKHCLSPNDGTTYVLRYNLLWWAQYKREKIYEPECQTLCSIKSQLLIPNVDLPYIFLNTRSRPLSRKCPILHTRSAFNIANTSGSDINPNATSSVTVTFIQLV